MLKKQEILAVYQKGPQAICDSVHHLENQIQDLKERIEELEDRSKKTLQMVHRQIGGQLGHKEQFFYDCFGHSISKGTLVNHTNAFSAQLQPFIKEVKEKILQSPVVHFDETGMRVENKTQ